MKFHLSIDADDPSDVERIMQILRGQKAEIVTVYKDAEAARAERISQVVMPPRPAAVEGECARPGCHTKLTQKQLDASGRYCSQRCANLRTIYKGDDERAAQRNSAVRVRKAPTGNTTVVAGEGVRS